MTSRPAACAADSTPCSRIPCTRVVCRAHSGSLTRQSGKEGRPRIKVEALHLKAVRRTARVVVRLHHGDAVAVPCQQRGAAQACRAPGVQAVQSAAGRHGTHAASTGSRRGQAFAQLPAARTSDAAANDDYVRLVGAVARAAGRRHLGVISAGRRRRRSCCHHRPPSSRQCGCGPAAAYMPFRAAIMLLDDCNSRAKGLLPAAALASSAGLAGGRRSELRSLLAQCGCSAGSRNVTGCSPHVAVSACLAGGLAAAGKMSSKAMWTINKAPATRLTGVPELPYAASAICSRSFELGRCALHRYSHPVDVTSC